MTLIEGWPLAPVSSASRHSLTATVHVEDRAVHEAGVVGGEVHLAGPGEMPSFVPWVHVLPAAIKISVWLEEKADTTESDYLVASQARSLINRLARDLETAGINTQPLNPAHGADYLPVFADISNALLARLGVADEKP